MTRAINSQTTVSYLVEATENTIPATPPWLTFRATGESLTVDRTMKFSSELNGRRGERNAVLASSMGSGGLNFEFSAATLEDFLRGALRSDWVANVMTDANTPPTFAMETRFEDGAVDIFKRLTGAQVNTFSIDCKAAEVVTGSVSLLSRSGDFANTGVAGATYTDGNTEPINVGANVGSLTLTGLTLDVVTGVSLNINNNLRALFGLGGITPAGITAGKLEITGTLSAVLTETEYNLLRAAADATATGLTFQVGLATPKLTKFELPNIYLETPKVESQSVDGDVMVAVNFRALQATSLTKSVIRVTRSL